MLGRLVGEAVPQQAACTTQLIMGQIGPRQYRAGSKRGSSGGTLATARPAPSIATWQFAETLDQAADPLAARNPGVQRREPGARARLRISSPARTS